MTTSSDLSSVQSRPFLRQRAGKLTMVTVALFSLFQIDFPLKTYAVKKELAETLNAALPVYHHEDPETTAILNLMSGCIAQHELEELLLPYGYRVQQVSQDSLRTRDEVLYHTLREIHTKFGNPRLSFKGDFRNYEHVLSNRIHFWKPDQKREWEYDRPRYNFFSNKIALYDLSFVQLDFHQGSAEQQQREELYRKQEGTFPSTWRANHPQRKLINYWISELSHAVHAEGKGIVPFFAGLV